MRNSLMWQSGIVAKWRLSENRAKLACALPSVSHFDDVRVAFSKKEKSATSYEEIADTERLTSFCSDCEWAVAHATRSSKGSQGCRED